MVKSAKSNTKVIKIAPEVDVQASNKTKQDIKKLTQQLEFTLTGVGKGLTQYGIGGLNKSSNDAVKNIIKEFEKLNPALQKEIKSGYGEISKFFNSIQREFVKENENLAKEAKKNLKEIKSAFDSLSKSAKEAYSSYNKLVNSPRVKILDIKPEGKGIGVYKTREDRQRTYESLFANPEGMYNDFILKQKRANWLSQIRQRKIIRPRVLENIEASRLARESSGFSQFEAKASGIKFNDEFTANAYNERMEAIYSNMSKKGEKFLQDFSRRMTIYFTYKTIDLFTNSVTGAVDSLVKLQSAFANIQAITASTTGQMEKIRKAVFDVGVNTRFATEEVADAAVVLGQAGLSTQEIASVLEHTATLASATGEDLKNTAGLMTSVLSIWNMNADQASHVADVFVTSANDTKATLDSLSYGIQYAGTSLAQLGVSFEEASAVMSASTNAGLKSSSMLGTGMRALATELTNQSKRMQDTLASLGLTFDDVDIQSLGLIKVLKNLKEAGFGATEAFAAFDRRAATYALAALSELDTAEKLTEEFNRSGAAAKANATQMATLESQLISLQDIIAKGLSSSFRVLTELLTGLLSGINGFLKAADGLSVRMITSATSVGVVTASLTKLKNIYRSIRAYQLSTFRVEAIKQLKLEISGTERLTAAMVKQRAVALSLAKAWQVLKASFIWATLLTAASYGFDLYFKFFKSLEDQIAELNETMETHRSTVNSTKSDLEELSNKERLYTSDVEALNRRIEELNRKYSETGFVQKYADETDNLKDKLLELRDALKEVEEIENLRRAKAREEAADKRIEKIEGDIKSFTPKYNTGQNIPLIDIIDTTRSELDKFLSKNDITGAKNYLLSAKADYSQQMSKSYFYRSDEFLNEKVDEFDNIFSQYISAKFEKASAELDRLGREEESEEDYESYENRVNQQSKNAAFVVESSFNNIMKGLSNAETIDDESVTKAINTVNSQIENIILSEMDNLLSELETAGKTHTSIYGNLKNTRANLEKEDSWRRFFSTKHRGLLEKAYDKGLISKFALESILGPQDISMEDLLEKNLKEKNKKDPRTNAFLDRLRNDLSNISDTTKSSKKARDLALKGYQYNGGMTSTQSGLYKTYSDEMNLLETARNTERYAKVLEELKTEYKSLFNEYKSGTIDRENLSRVEVTALDLMKDTENKLNESKDAYEIITGKTYEYGASLADLNQKILELQIKLDETTEQNLNPFQQVLQGITNKYLELMKRQKEEGSVFTQLGETIYNSGLTNMENALISICDRTKSVSDAFRQMLADILKEIRNFLIKQAVKQFFMMLGSMFVENMSGQGSNWDPAKTPPPSKPTITRASGGMVTGGIKGRDSVHTKLMPGEYVIKKSAVDVLGTKFLNNLNTNTTQTMNTVGAMMGGTSLEGQSEPAVVNVWVVSERDEAQMGPNDVIATISKDLQQGGTTKKLIQTIVAGRKA